MLTLAYVGGGHVSPDPGVAEGGNPRVGVSRFVAVGVIVHVGSKVVVSDGVRLGRILVEVGDGVKVLEGVNVRGAEMKGNAPDGTIVLDGRIGLGNAPALPQPDSSTIRTIVAFRSKEYFFHKNSSFMPSMGSSMAYRALTSA